MEWLKHFFQIDPIPTVTLGGTYDPYLVILSYIIASIASYVALDMSSHLRRGTILPKQKILWLISGAFAMGAGIWSMHFVGMLAFKMPAHDPMIYDAFWTILSMVVAIVTAAIAFLLFMIKNPSVKHYALSGLMLGAAIPTMHYTGMTGMLGVHIHYIPSLFILSILIAVVAACVALWLAVQSDKGSYSRRVRLKIGAGLIMGVAIAGMHYMGMAAAVFTPHPMMHHAVGGLFSLEPTIMAFMITTIVLVIMLFAMVVSTAKHILVSAIQSEKDFLEAVLDNMRGGVVACDNQGKITLVNNTVIEAFGAFSKNLSPEEWSSLYPIFDVETGAKLTLEEYPLYRSLQGEVVRDVQISTFDKRGEKRIFLIDGQPLKNDDQKIGAVIVFHDISKIKRDEEELKYRATHDILTGLPNRHLLLDRLELAIANATRHSLKVATIFVDLDNFKFINDALGHTIGDELLKMVAARFKSLLRSSDTLARIGGDEFVIIIPDQKDISYVSALPKRILNHIAEPYFVEKHELRVTCSLGFSIFPDNGTEAETLLKNADNAMYQAKESGRNTFQFYTGEMHTQVRKRLEMENNLRKAIIGKELFVEYQPKIDIKNNQLVGVESLLRWKHPELGLIPPVDFIPIAEDTGLIIPIGDWVLKIACKQNKAWQDQGFPPMSVSVNLSSRQCRQKDLVQKIKQILEEARLSPQYLELELTESLAMSNPKEFLEMLQEFRELGVKTSIDDFGTGYSSLNYLRQFPVNNLKIDKSFINDLAEKPEDLSIVKAIISLGHSLDLKIIAEGVETNDQLIKLKENDCDEVQGYYLCRPVGADAIVEFLKTSKYVC